MKDMRIFFSSTRAAFFRFGIAAGVVVSFAVTLIVVIWEWLENPGGIFHNDNGTNWEFVLDTAISWFVPTFVHVAVIASIAHLLWSAFRRYRNKDDENT
jgi:hypothetical protein